MEVLEDRLASDRSVIKNLVIAAQHWEEFRKVLKVQLSRIEFLGNIHEDARWSEGRGNFYATLALASSYLPRFQAVDFRIQSELMAETDALIQRITNLISIDEGYRSRDQNESIRRLTWITFIFLPLVFASALFSMQVDLFTVSPPWQYFIYTCLVLMGIVLGGWLLLRSRRRASMILKVIWMILKALFTAPFILLSLIWKKLQRRKTKRKYGNDIEKQSFNSAEESATLLGWAASSGNTDVLRSILGTSPNNGAPGYGISGSALVKAIQNGHMEAVNLLINTEDGLDYVDSIGATPLHWAAKGGHSEICQTLLSKGVLMNARTYDYETALDWAMAGAHESTINLLLRGDKKLAKAGTFDIQTLHFSAQTGDIKLIKQFYESGSSIEVRDSKGQTVLFHAIKAKQIKVIRWLLETAKANVHAVDKDGLSPLHIAVRCNNFDAVSLLLNFEADVNARSGLHLAPIHLIENDKGTNILKLLLDKSANIEATTKDGTRLVHIAASNGTEAIKLFREAVSRGANLYATRFNGDTPAHCAASSGCEKALRILKSESVDYLQCRNVEGYTPLMSATQHGHTEVMAFLLENGASLSVTDINGLSLTELSIKWGNPEAINVLQAHGAEFDALNTNRNSGDTVHPIWEAVRDGQHAALLQLIKGGFSANFTSKEHIGLLQRALESGNVKAAAVLLESGASVDAKDNYGWTALHSAAFGGSIPCMLIVLQKTNNIYPIDNQGWTPLDIAHFYDFKEIAKLLDREGKVKDFPWQLKREKSINVLTGKDAANVVDASQGKVVEAPGDAVRIG